MKDIMRKLRRNTKALSPIFAVLILIAIAVIGGIVIYMFTSGYLGTMMGGVKCTGGGDVVITDAILKDGSGNNVDVLTLTTLVADRTVPADGTLTDIVCAFTLNAVDAGYTYTVTLVSQVGNQFVSPSFKG